MGLAASEVKLDSAALTELTRSFAGQLIRPADAGYDEHRRVWNGSIDRHPALIARCTGPDDVRAALGFAAGSGLPVAVRGGGHSFPGHSTCDGGIVVDLGPMKGIEVDPEARTARVQAGVLWGELDQETQQHGLATTGGIVTHTGVAGLTLGGGIGWLQRAHGLTIDNLLGVELVTAGGELLRASASENPELFWGVRGAGGNFGIVTEFQFRLHRVGPTVLAGPMLWPIEEAPRLLRFYREWIAEAPDELMTIVMHRKAPALPFVPPELHGELVVGIACCHAGSVEEGLEAVAPLKAFGSPVVDLCEPKPYVEHQQMFDASYPHGWWYYIRALDVAELSDAVIDITVEHAAADPVAAHHLPDLAVGRSGRPRRRGRDGLQRPRRRPHLQPQRDQRDRGGVRRGARVVARLLGRTAAPPDGRVRELPHGGGRAARPRRLRAAQVRPSQGAQGALGPRQPLPAQPEHPARLTRG